MCIYPYILINRLTAVETDIEIASCSICVPHASLCSEIINPTLMITFTCTVSLMQSNFSRIKHTNQNAKALE